MWNSSDIVYFKDKGKNQSLNAVGGFGSTSIPLLLLADLSW
jgi:hypothetical protein